MVRNFQSIVYLFLLSVIMPIPTLRAQWIRDGIPVCLVPRDKQNHQMVSDGNGGAVVVWEESRNGPDYGSDIYAQRLDNAGNYLWGSEGIAICCELAEQSYPQIIRDSESGYIVTWIDRRNGVGHIYAQRVDSLGICLWLTSGIEVYDAGSCRNSQIVTSGYGGAIITWRGINGIFAQKIDIDGNALWTLNGVAICTASSYQNFPMIISDNAEGAIITWQDGRNDGYDIYAQRVYSNGNINWDTNGVAICTANHYQESPNLISDNNGGAIITWCDFRSYDIHNP